MITSFTRSKVLQQKSHMLIPGGSHTFAKGDDQYPEQAPGFIIRGEGCHVWDIDENEFIEYGMGLRSVTLGHAYKPVVEAAYKQMLLGSNYTRPSVLEVQFAEEIVQLIDAAEMVSFCKNGSDATTAAIRVARAYTGRDMVAICGDQPFLSTDDWFIGTTPMSAGIPKVIQDLTVKFQYNSISSIKKLFEDYPGKIACIIMEPATYIEPVNGFLHEARSLCRENGAIFILDEMITGFRWHIGGAQKYYGIDPDLSTFGKAIGNGFSVSALLGKREFMELGGLHHDKKRVFLLSTTHGAENHAVAAAQKVIEIYKTENVIEFLKKQGQMLRDGINRIINELDLNDYFQVLGMPSNLIYVTRDQDKQPSQSFRTLFLQETIKRGLLMPSMVVSFSHTDEDINKTIEGVAEALWIYKKALEEGIDKYLEGRPVKPVFRQYN